MTHNTQKILSILVAVLTLILLLLYMQGSFVAKVAPGTVADTQAKALPPITTSEVETKTVDDLLLWPGTVHSLTVTNIAAKLTARIIEIKVKAGDHVKKGDIVARLDERNIQAKEHQALAEVDSANAQENRSKADQQRIGALYEKEAATRENFDAVVARAKEAQALTRLALSRLNEVRSYLEDTTLRAPFDGLIVRRFKESGDMTLPGETVATLQTPRGLRLEAEVPGNCASRLTPGMAVKVRIDTLKTISMAHIDEITPELDPQTGTQLVKVVLPQLEGLQPGYFGWLEQACAQHEALLIPVSAIIHIGQLEAVKVLTAGKILMRHIRSAKTFGQQIEVISGLHAGETVITDPQTQP